MAVFKKLEVRYTLFAIFALLMLFRFQTAHIAINVDEHFLLLHTLIELFSIFVSISIFVQSWITYSTHRIKSQYFIGLVFLAVGCFDLIHTFTYKGMPYFDDTLAPTRATWFWIIARLTESIGVALFVFRPNLLQSIKRGPGLIISTIFISGIIAIVMGMPNQLPVLVDSQGVTGLKVALEYVICMTLLITIIIQFKKYKATRPNNELLRMIFSLFIIMVGELFFTLYTHVYAIENLLGHVFKFIGFAYLYKSIYFPEIQQILSDKENAEKQKMETELKLYETEKNLARQVFEAHEEERKRVSRELHDSIGQSLYSILVTLNTLKKENPIEQNEDHLNTVKQMTQQAMKEVKEIARSLRPSVLDDLGFIPAIRAYLETYEQIHNIQVQFNISGDAERLDSEVETALYRIGQEALNNTAKYAQATKVTISLQFKENATSLTITDNGVGFCLEDYLQHAHRKGIGLYSIKERAEGVGGFAVFHSEVNRGTTIEIFIPKPTQTVLKNEKELPLIHH